MPKLTIKIYTRCTPERFVAALTDFGPGRSKLWPNSQDDYLTVYNEQASKTEVTEGSNFFGGVWERLHYNWSDPERIKLTTIDSNFWKPGSSWTYEFTRKPAGDLYTLNCTIRRSPKNVKAVLALLFVGAIGKVVLKKQLVKTVKMIETQ